jgi:hypothetical protein
MFTAPQGTAPEEGAVPVSKCMVGQHSIVKLVGTISGLPVFQSPEFDDLAARLKFGDDTWELVSKDLRQRLLPAIADPHPNQFAGPARNTGKEREILVFADDDQAVDICVPPDFRVIGLH